MGHAFRQRGLDLLFYRIVDQVTFRDREHPPFGQEVGVVEFEFLQKGRVRPGDVVLLHADHEEQYGVALDVAEEAYAYALAFVGSLDDSGDVGHHERLAVVVADYAEVWFEGREGVGRNLWLCGGHGAQQRGLAGVGEADETHVGEQLEFEDEPVLLPVFARLGETRGLEGRGLEVAVAEAAAAALAEDALLSGVHEFEEDFSGLSHLGHRADRHFEHYVPAVLAMAVGRTSGLAVLGLDVLAVLEVDERPELGIGPQYDVSSPAAVASVGSALRDVFRTVQMHRACASVSGCAEYLDVVYEIAVGHIFLLINILNGSFVSWTGKKQQAGNKIFVCFG